MVLWFRSTGNPWRWVLIRLDRGVSADSRVPGDFSIWPVLKDVSKKLCRVWDHWLLRLCVSDRVRFNGRESLKSGVLRACSPDVPPDWSTLQRTMELAKPDLKGKAVMGDDKDHSKIWVSDEGELCRG